MGHRTTAQITARTLPAIAVDKARVNNFIDHLFNLRGFHLIQANTISIERSLTILKQPYLPLTCNQENNNKPNNIAIDQ